MKKILSISLALILVMQVAGCETIQRKFTRKKKRKPIRPKFYGEGMAETRPNLELYMMHYTYWKTWHEDLIEKAGTNAKRDAMASDEMVGHLMDMKRYLLQEKAEELNEYIEQLKKIAKGIKSGSITDMRMGRTKQRLDNIRARIARKFYYKKVRDFIKPD